MSRLVLIGHWLYRLVRNDKDVELKKAYTKGGASIIAGGGNLTILLIVFRNICTIKYAKRTFFERHKGVSPHSCFRSRVCLGARLSIFLICAP
jgi:hypothetical protein